jgi:hypothetical protein
MQPQSRYAFEEMPDTELNDILLNAQDNYTKGEMQSALAEKSRRMNEQQTVLPPVQNETAEWYYAANGKRAGSFTQAQMINLLNKEVIDYSTKVWKPGMKDWKEFEKTDLAAVMENRDLPPPIPESALSNGLVWLVAYMPFISLAAGFLIYLIFGQPFSGMWYVAFAANCILCLYDDYRLKLSGYSVKLMWIWGITLIPVYLFRRAAVTKQKPWYAVMWCLTFVIVQLSPWWGASLLNIGNNRFVIIVKNGTLKSYTDKTVGQAVDGYFENTRWQAIEATDGKKYVNAVGNVTYQNKTVIAALQFNVEKDNNITINALEFNGMPQNRLVIFSLLSDMYGHSSESP